MHVINVFFFENQGIVLLCLLRRASIELHTCQIMLTFNVLHFNSTVLLVVVDVDYIISINFSEDLIFAFLARLFCSLKLCIANTTSCLDF